MSAYTADSRSAGRIHIRGGCWLPVLAALAVLTPALLWFPLLRATVAPAIAYNEGWNTYWQQAAASGQALFAAPPGLTVENYPPLSFHVIGWLGAWAGDTNMMGRAVALVSLGTICVLCGVIAARLSGRSAAGWYAGLCVPVWIGVFSSDRIGMNDPQWLGMAAELLGFYWCLRSSGRAGLIGGAVLFALGVFTKQHLIAFPLAVGAMLMLRRRWTDLAVWIGAGALAAGTLFAVTILVDGPFFLDHLLRPRAADWATGQRTVGGYLILFAPALVLAVTWMARVGWADRRPMGAAWVFANLLGLGLAFGHGVANNILFEAVVANAIVLALSCADLFDPDPRRRPAGSRFVSPWTGRVVTVFPVIWPLALLPVTLTYGFHAWQGLQRVEDGFEAGVGVLRSVNGPVWCEDLLLCQAAGKPMVFDAYFTLDQIQTGRLPECAVLDRLARQEPALVEIGAPSDNDAVLPEARLRFTAGFMRTLLHGYAPVLRTHDFTVLAPVAAPGPVGACE